MAKLTRRTFIAAAGAAVAAPALAAFPDKPIRIIVPWNAGAAADVMTRAIGIAMAQSSGPPVVVDNRPGANGAIGSQAVSRAQPDGYTLLVSNADTHAINPFVFRKLAYDPLKGFEPVSLFAHVPFALVAGPSRPQITDLKSFVATAKASPSTLTFASWGNGSTSHIGMEIIMRSVGIEMTHVPFTGQSPGLLAVQGGQVDAMLLTAGGADAAAKGGLVKMLGLAADKRLPLMASTPTLKELGVDVLAGNWFALHAPAGTPADVVRQLSDYTARALQDAKVQEILRLQAAVGESSSPDTLGRFVVAEQARWGRIVRAANIVID